MEDRAEFIGRLIVYVMISWYDVHCDTMISERLEEMFPVMVERFKVYELAVFIIIAAVEDVLDSMLLKIWKENLTIKPSLII